MITITIISAINDDDNDDDDDNNNSRIEHFIIILLKICDEFSAVFFFECVY